MSDNLEITRVLGDWNQATNSDRERVYRHLYVQLQQIARRQLAQERDDVILEPSMLVHEAYLRLVHLQQITWQGRVHFLATAARIMRQILVDQARERGAAKRDPGAGYVLTLDLLDNPMSTSIALLDEAMQKLALVDSFYAQVVEARFFGGLTIDETAEALDVSETTIKRAWLAARAWLLLYLEQP